MKSNNKRVPVSEESLPSKRGAIRLVMKHHASDRAFDATLEPGPRDHRNAIFATHETSSTGERFMLWRLWSNYDVILP